MKSRWSQGKDLSWEPVRAELVVEVAYEHMQGTRFRHMAQFRRWRIDKQPSDCTFAQLEVVPPQELMEIFATGRLLLLLRDAFCTPLTGRIVVRIWSFLGRPHIFWNVTKIDSDACPGRGFTSHRVDKHIVYGQ